jgi:hypothetical protein
MATKIVLKFTQRQYDGLPPVGIGSGIPNKFYKTSSGVTTWVEGKPDGVCSNRPGNGYWLDFDVRVVDDSTVAVS